MRFDSQETKAGAIDTSREAAEATVLSKETPLLAILDPMPSHQLQRSLQPQAKHLGLQSSGELNREPPVASPGENIYKEGIPKAGLTPVKSLFEVS